MLLATECIDDAVGGEGRRATVRMVHDNDVLDAEEVLGHGNRAQRVERAASGNDDRKDGRRRCDLMTLIVENDLAGIDVIEALRDERRDFGCSRVVALYDDGPERHGL